jgi:hypothetical protein
MNTIRTKDEIEKQLAEVKLELGATINGYVEYISQPDKRIAIEKILHNKIHELRGVLSTLEWVLGITK